jgi:hypothetical protein
VTTQRGSVRHQTRLVCSPDRVWQLVGDPARLAEWFPGITSCTVDGTQRTVTTGSGLAMPEQILTVDDALRRMQYRITAPLFRQHLGTIDVLDLADGTTLVVYGTDAEPAVLALVIGGAARAGLARLPELLGVPAAPASSATESGGFDGRAGPRGI